MLYINTNRDSLRCTKRNGVFGMGAAGFATPPLTFCANPEARGNKQNITDGIKNPVRRKKPPASFQAAYT